MKYKTLFRVLLKAIGIAMVGWSAPPLLSAVAQIAVEQVITSSGSVVYWPWLIGQVVAQSLMLVFGLYLFFGGRWIVDRAIPGNRPYCHECGYDLTANTTGNCPECDTPTIHTSGPLLRERK